MSNKFRNQAANSACAGAARPLEITMDSLKIISPSTCHSATYSSLSSYSTSDTLSSRTSTCSSFYSSGYSDDDWDDDSGSGDEIQEYRRRLSQECRKRMIKKLDSLRYNPNHHMRRIVPVGDGSTVDGGDLLEVSCQRAVCSGLIPRNCMQLAAAKGCSQNFLQNFSAFLSAYFDDCGFLHLVVEQVLHP